MNGFASQWNIGGRGEPTESINGNNHRKKTIKFWSNGITCLYRKCMVFPLKDGFTIENGLLFVKIFLYFDVILLFHKKKHVKLTFSYRKCFVRLKTKVNFQIASKYIENKCSH